MKSFASGSVVAALLLLAGCGSAPQNKSTASTSAASPAASAAPGAAAATPIAATQTVRVPAESAKKVVLNKTGAKASLDANVSFSDLNTGQRFGDQAYNTMSSAWSGVFAKMTPQQVDAIGSGVFGEIKTR